MPVELGWTKELMVPGIILLIAILAGVILQYFVNNRLMKLAARTKWRGDEIILQGLKGKIIVWTIIIGLYSVLPMLKLPPEYNELARKVLLILVIFSITMAASAILGGFIRLYSGDGKTGVLSTSIFTIITKVVVISIGVMIILQTLDISITPILTALGIGGLAVALALQDTLSNLFAGFHLLLTRKVRVNDWIKLVSGDAGEVIDIAWRNTTIRQLNNNVVIIPNSTLASSITTNFSLPEKELTIQIEVGVSYDSDLEVVEKVTMEVGEEVMNNTSGGVPGFKPLIRFTAFGDSSIDFNVTLQIEEYNQQFRVRHEFIKKLHKRFKQEGIVIPFPIRTLDFPKNSGLYNDKMIDGN